MSLAAQLAAQEPRLTEDGTGPLAAGEFAALRDAYAAQMARSNRPVALLAANAIATLAFESACAVSGRPLLVLPAFFSEEILRHAVEEVRPEWLACDDPALATRLGGLLSAEGFDGLCLWRMPGEAAALPPPGTARITYTSGSTARPKGICLPWPAIERSAAALRQAIGAGADDVFLSFMPYSILLETMTGFYLPLLCGSRAVVLPGIRLPLADPVRILAAIREHGVTVTVMMPQMLRDLCHHLRQHPDEAPTSLRFIGVGGAKVGRRLVEEALALGLPIGEGYGLTEAGSVVCLNRPGAGRPGSVGRPLDHIRLAIAADGEVLLAGAGASCLLDGSAPFWHEGWLSTGDLGEVDEAGYLWITGRKKNLFISSQGRNLSPEWLEDELLAERGLQRAFVFGEGRPAPLALVCSELGEDCLETLRRRLNQGLPAHARLAAIRRVAADFFLSPGLLTGNGRFVRPACEAAASPLFDTHKPGDPI